MILLVIDKWWKMREWEVLYLSIVKGKRGHRRRLEGGGTRAGGACSIVQRATLGTGGGGVKREGGSWFSCFNCSLFTISQLDKPSS